MKKYIHILVGIAITAFAVIIVLCNLSIVITNCLNNKYLELYKAGATGVTAPWYYNGYHIVDGRFIDELSALKKHEKNVISIGSSVSIIGFCEELTQNSDYVYRFMTSGNGCYASDRILYNLLQDNNLIEDEDIVKLEVSFSTFRNNEMTITETMLDKWNGLYINTCLIRIQSLWNLFLDYAYQVINGSHGIGLTERANEFGYFSDGSYDETIIPGNYRNNYYDPVAVADSLDYSEEMGFNMGALIGEINSNHKLLVEISPFPPALLNTEFGEKYNSYIDDKLIPYLQELNIKYVDYRYCFSQKDYADGVHLGYEAGVLYTKTIMEDINDY